VPAAGVIDDTVVNRALADTDAMIDGFLMGRYSLPLAATPPLLTDIAGAIAIYKLHRAAPEEKIIRDYDEAVKRLKDIAQGMIRLEVAGAEPTGGTGGQVETNQPARPMAGGPWGGFI
jgi:phage gp36-like protein